MDIVIGCEKSGVIRDAFRNRGHNAISVDLEPTEIDGPHEQMDIFLFLQKWQKWDMAIFHPECKYLCFSGEKWRTIGNKDYKKGHFRKRLQALAFFKRLWNQNGIPSIVLENSHSPFINRYFRPSDQIIQPYQFGDPYRKQTHLWLKNTPPLIYTSICQTREAACHLEPPGPKRSANRAKSYQGIANAMAEQWG